MGNYLEDLMIRKEYHLALTTPWFQIRFSIHQIKIMSSIDVCLARS